MTPPPPAPIGTPLTVQCFVHSTTSEILCGPPHLLHNALDPQDHEAKLLPLPWQTFKLAPTGGCHDEQSNANSDWQTYLSTKLEALLQPRSAIAEPEPEPMTVTVSEPAHVLERRKKPKTTSGSSNHTSAAGRTAVGFVGAWVALGWVVIHAY